jgi:hypothetical protein
MGGRTLFGSPSAGVPPRGVPDSWSASAVTVIGLSGKSAASYHAGERSTGDRIHRPGGWRLRSKRPARLVVFPGIRTVRDPRHI